MKKISLCFGLLLCVLYAQAQQNSIDALHYRFELTLRDSSDEIRGLAQVQLRLRQQLDAVELDLMGKDAGGGMTAEKVEMNHLPLRFVQEQGKLRIELPAPARTGDTLNLRIRYRGVPADGLVIGRNRHGDRTFFGDNWPNRARHWLPVNDHPSDKATCEFIVQAPVTYEVVSNGHLVEKSALNTRQMLTHWRSDLPLPTKVMVIGAARFAISHEPPVNGVPLSIWVYPQDREKGFKDFRPASLALAFMDMEVGPYPFEKLANVQSTTRFGGMENAGCIFYAENSVNGKTPPERLIAHEVAHQWFGNSATEADWTHLWLSEGFATYFAHLYTEAVYGPEAMARDLQRDRGEVLDYAASEPLQPVVPLRVADPMTLLSPNSYQKGAWILHMLRHEVGDSLFREGIRRYYTRYRYGNASTDDFRIEMEAVSGRPLSSFFRQWLYQPGAPRLEGSWHYDGSRKILAVTVIQTAQRYELPIEIGIYEGGFAPLRIEAVRLKEREQQWEFPLSKPPVRVELDPRTRLLFEGSLIQVH